MTALNLFVPLTKIDVENRLVYGVVAAEVVDNAGEMFDYEKSKPYFQKWSANAELTSGGLSKGNLREMHGKVAAGKLTDLAFNDDTKTIECCAKVVDDQAWAKCLEGVYTGFSMGGRYAEKWVEKMAGAEQKRYAGDPAEISLVDKPCIPTATFQLIKADGMVEECHFTSVMDDEELEKAGGKQPREPGGTPKGGQFASSGGASASSLKSGGWGEEGGVFSHPKSTDSKSGSVSVGNAGGKPAYRSSVYNGGRTKIESHVTLDDAVAHVETFMKSDTGDILMKRNYVPTNDELAARGMELAKAAGKTDADWLEFSDAARQSLIDENLAKADDGDDAEDGSEVEDGEDKGDFDGDAEKGPKPDGSDDDGESASSAAAKEKKEGDEEKPDDKDKEGKGKPFGKADAPNEEQTADADATAAPEEAAEKSDSGTGDAVEQGWRATDGSFHLKKADAIAHNEALKKAADAPETLLGLVGELAKTVADVTGEEAPEGDDAETVEKSDLIKYAEFLEGAATLAKADDAEGQELNKSMYTVERMARVLRDVASLQIAVSKEQKREGDDSQTPGMIGIAVGQLGDTLIEMTKEEVGELMLTVANDGVAAGDQVAVACFDDCYYELAASTLGLEKADFDELAKAAGAKKAEHVQKMHDKMSKMGAKCAGLEKADADELAKMDGANAELLKRAIAAEEQIAEAMPLIKSLMADVAKIKDMPQPPAPRTSVMEKADDGKGVPETRARAADDLLKSHTPEQLAEAAIRMSQQHGVHMTSRGISHRQ